MDSEGSVRERFIFYGESTVLISLFLAGLVANIPVLVVYCRSKHIRSITDKFLLNLLIADLVSVTLLFPSILTNFLQYSRDGYDLELREGDFSPSSGLHGGHDGVTDISSPGREYGHPHFNRSEGPSFEFKSGYSMYWNWSCGVNNGLLAGLATASVLAAVEIAMERYLAVVTPLHYHKFLTTPSILITSLIGGFISIASAVIASFDQTHSVFPTCMSHIHKLEVGERIRLEKSRFNATSGHLHVHSVLNADPDYLQETEDPSQDIYGQTVSSNEIMWSIYVLIHLTVFFVIPVILMTFVYIRIWIEARRQKIRMSQRYKPYFLPVPVDQINSVKDELKSSKQKFHPILIRFRLMERLRATRIDRAARVAVLTLFVTIMCWSPYYFLKGSDAIRNILILSGSLSASAAQVVEDGAPLEHPSWTNLGSILPLLCASLHPLLAPLFYAYRYKRLRTEIMKTVCDQISSLVTCTDHHDKGNPLDSKIARGLSTSSTFGGTPCIRQTIVSHPEKTSIIITGIENEDVEDGLVIVPSSRREAIVQGHSHISIDLDPEEGRGGRSHTHPVRINVSHEMGEECLSHIGPVCSDLDDGPGEVVVSERKGIMNYLSVWMNSYSRRWLQHRESVTSTASFITLLSNKYHNNKTHPVASV